MVDGVGVVCSIVYSYSVGVISLYVCFIASSFGFKPNYCVFSFQSQQLLHVLTNLCLQRGTEVPVMNPCDENNLHQKWTFSRNYHDSTHQTINSDKQNDH